MKQAVPIRFLATVLLLCLLMIPFPLSAKEASADKVSHALLYCLNNQTVLFEKNAHSPIAPAQTAQMMTALLALEHYGDFSQTVRLEAHMLPSWTTVGDYHNPAVYGFTKGKELPVWDLFATLVLENSNAAALLLAALIAGDASAFVSKMNQRATELGMENTVYQNPTGVDAEGAVTTPADTLKLATYLYKDKRYMDLASSPSYALANISYTVYSRNYFIGRWYNTSYYYSAADGMLAGYTDQAGFTLIASATEADGYSYLAILFGGRTDAEGKNTAYLTARDLFAWGSTSFQYRKVLSSSRLMGTLPVVDGEGTSSAPLFPVKDLTAYLNKELSLDTLSYEVELHSDTLTAPIEKGSVVGKVTVYSGEEMIGECDLIIAKNVTKAKSAIFREFLGRFFKNPITVVAILFLLLLFTRKILIYLHRRKKALQRQQSQTDAQ